MRSAFDYISIPLAFR